MTMLMNRLNNIENTITAKEQLIEQLRDDISNLQQQVHAVKGVSELAENLKALALQTWMSIYTVCPEEEELILAELEQARLDAKAKVEAGIPQLVESVEVVEEIAEEAIEVTAEEVEEIAEAVTEVEAKPIVEDRVLTEEDLNVIDMEGLKKFATEMGVRARKRETITKELIHRGITLSDLNKVLPF